MRCISLAYALSRSATDRATARRASVSASSAITLRSSARQRSWNLRSPFLTRKHPGLLIGDVFRNAARAVPNRVAAVLDGASVTFADVDRQSNRLGHTLH